MNDGAGPRAGIVATLAAALLVAVAGPAVAHTRAAAASNYESRITATPDVAGVAWRTYAGGDLVEVTLTADVEVAVAGYEGEPYLRVTPGGVFSNANSPATYLNADRYGDVAVPPRVDAAAPPEWRRVSHEPSYAWHDHRVHWMSPSPPPAVQGSPAAAQLVQPWVVVVTVDGRSAELRGELWWVPGTATAPWLAVALVLTAPAAAGVVGSRRRARGGDGRARPRLEVVRGYVRPAAATVAAVAGVNLLHVLDEFAAWPAPTLDIVFGLLHTALFVGAGLAGAALAWRATQGPFLSLGIASGAVLFHQGLLQWPLLGASQLPTVWPAPLLRLAVAVSIVQAVWLAAVLAIGMRAAGPATELPVPAPAPAAVGHAAPQRAPTCSAPPATTKEQQCLGS